MTPLLAIPPALLPVGQHGPFISDAIPANPAGWVLTITKAADYPATGDVFGLLIEQAPDGTNFVPDVTNSWGGGEWKLRDGATTLEATLHVSGWHDDVTTRKIRVTLTLLQACTLGLALASL